MYQDEADLSDSEKLALFYISFTGCCLSMVALFLTIMTFAAFRFDFLCFLQVLQIEHSKYYVT